jgi:hypothetical protein
VRRLASRRAAAALAGALIAGAGAGRLARAELADTARDVGEATGYAVPAIAAAITSVANGTALAYGASVSGGWRLAGWIAGAVEVGIGTGLLVWRHDTSYQVALGAVPLALGVASLATATFVDQEVTVGVAFTPWVSGDAAGAALRLPW